MFIQGHRDLLLKQLQIVVRAVPSKTIISALFGVLFQAEGERITLTANDLEISISTQTHATVIEAGEVVIPAKLLTEAIKRCPDQDVVIKHLPEKNLIQIVSGAMQMELLALSAEDFPEQPSFLEEHHYIIPQDLVKNMIRQVDFAISNEELRPILTGALWAFTSEELRMVALDGFRLACRWSDLKNPHQASKAVIPAKALKELARLLTDEDSECHVSIGSTYASFDFSGVRLVTRLLEGQFPTIDQFVPKQYQTRVVVNAEGLCKALERAALVSQTGLLGSVKLTIEKNKLAVSAQSMEIGRHYEEWGIQSTGADLQVMFNIRAFIEILRSAECEEVVLDLHGSYGPCICRPVGQDNYFNLLMPVRLS